MAVLDPAADAPCATICDCLIRGSLNDPHSIERLVRSCEVTTYEIEHIHSDTLQRLADEGLRLLPEPRVLAVVQDKLEQRRLFDRAGIPGPRWTALGVDESRVGPGNGESAVVSAFGLPAVQKLRRGGYDGRGVRILRGPTDALLVGDIILEELVSIEAEIAVLVARGLDGRLVCYHAVEMVFDPVANICTHVIAPARISPDVAVEAQRIAVAAVESLGGVGVHGVELFVATDGRVLLNEVAPRPHNSGHYTIDACITSQFGQHLRAVTGLPLGSPQALSPAVMVNLLGASGSSGSTVVDGVGEALSVPGVALHLYGKRSCSPGRKMGHLTAIAPTVDAAREAADRAAAALTIRGDTSE